MEAGICTGQTDAHIEYRVLCDHTGDKRPIGLQPEVWLAYDQMRNHAAEFGIDLLIASGFRDFDRQMSIWNAKVEGNRPVLDHDGVPLDLSALSDFEVCEAILRWSALPGASRHHWGTDLDVYDGSTIDTDYQLQLTPDEYAVDGPFHKLSTWLAEYAGHFHFARPYQFDSGGIAPEAWHLSYTPLADVLQAELSLPVLANCLGDSPLLLSETVLDHLAHIHNRFIKVTAITDLSSRGHA
ncbi:MAG: M15 family metallopeptidase [Pseudomonadales bacterium]